VGLRSLEQRDSDDIGWNALVVRDEHDDRIDAVSIDLIASGSDACPYSRRTLRNNLKQYKAELAESGLGPDSEMGVLIGRYEARLEVATDADLVADTSSFLGTDWPKLQASIISVAKHGHTFVSDARSALWEVKLRDVAIAVFENGAPLSDWFTWALTWKAQYATKSKEALALEDDCEDLKDLANPLHPVATSVDGSDESKGSLLFKAFQKYIWQKAISSVNLSTKDFINKILADAERELLTSPSSTSNGMMEHVQRCLTLARATLYIFNPRSDDNKEEYDEYLDIARADEKSALGMSHAIMKQTEFCKPLLLNIKRTRVTHPKALAAILQCEEELRDDAERREPKQSNYLIELMPKLQGFRTEARDTASAPLDSMVGCIVQSFAQEVQGRGWRRIGAIKINLWLDWFPDLIIFVIKSKSEGPCWHP